jgi:hyperosmotically inducible protein
MTRILALASILALAACGDSKPPAKPAAQPASPPPQAAAPETKAPEVKPPEAPKPDPNKELAQRVKQALEGDRKVQAGAIDVTAKDGRISLWGTTATADERNRAGQIAAQVSGVASVDNQLKVVKGS